MSPAPGTEMVVRKRSAGAVVMRREGASLLYLLLRVYRNWDFPKGQIEPGEEQIDTAVREVREETTVADLQFPWGLVYRETGPYGGKVARYYLATTGQRDISLPVNPALGRPEHHGYRWMDHQTARLQLPPRLLPILDWAQVTAAVPLGSRGSRIEHEIKL